MMAGLKEFAVCWECQLGQLKFYDRGTHFSCASYWMSRCKSYYATRNFWSVNGRFESDIPVGDKKIQKRNDMVYSTVLGHSFPSITCNFHLHSKWHPCTFRIHSTNQHGHRQDRHWINSPAQPTYQVCTCCGVLRWSLPNAIFQVWGGFRRYAFASALSDDTGKVLSYEVGCNSCKPCILYANKLRDNEITEEEHQFLYASHQSSCPATYPEYASVHLESLVAPDFVKQAYHSGVVFSGIVSDGDNKTDVALKNAAIYHKLGLD